jgi:hypothetical protein
MMMMIVSVMGMMMRGRWICGCYVKEKMMMLRKGVDRNESEHRTNTNTHTDTQKKDTSIHHK